MSLTKRFSNAWKALIAPTTTLSNTVPAVTSSEATLLKQETVWVDDEQLRALAQDSIDKTTHWVIAGDFQELFTWLDNFNQGKPENLRMKLEVSQKFHNDLKALRDERLFGDDVARQANDTGPIIINGANVQKTFGPMFIKDCDIRLSIGDVKIPTYYRGSMMDNTSINFYLDDQWTQIEFGMGHLPEFFGGKAVEKITQATMQPALQR
jgi:hypothetical protein